MTRSLNKVSLLGNLGNDPDTRYTQSGSAVTNFSIATTTTWRDSQTQEMRERTEWHKVVCWGRTAEIASEYLKKGRQVYVEGELRTRSWDRDGQKQYTTEVNARELILLGGPAQRGDSQGGDDAYQRRPPQSGGRRPQPTVQRNEPTPVENDDLDDDIPF